MSTLKSVYVNPSQMQHFQTILTAIVQGNDLPDSAVDHKLDLFTALEFDEIAKSATMHYLRHHSTDPKAEPFIAQLFSNDATELHANLLKLKSLAMEHTESEAWRLATEYREYQIKHHKQLVAQIHEDDRKKRLARTKAEYDDELRQWFAANHTEDNQYYDLCSTDFSTMSIRPGLRQRLTVFQGLVSGKYKNFKEAAKATGRTTTAITAVFHKELRRWLHPSRYGDVFQIETKGSLLGPTTTIELLNTGLLDSNGYGVWERSTNLTFAEAMAKARVCLEELGQTFKVQVQIIDSSDD